MAGLPNFGNAHDFKLITQQFHFPCVGVFCDKVRACVVCVYTRKEGLTECFLVTQGTQLVPLGDKSVPKMCLFIRLEIFRAWSKSFYWFISQVRFLSLKSQALTQPHNLKILDQQPGLLFASRSFLPRILFALWKVIALNFLHSTNSSCRDLRN